jgi:hypothetical protein
MNYTIHHIHGNRQKCNNIKRSHFTCVIPIHSPLSAMYEVYVVHYLFLAISGGTHCINIQFMLLNASADKKIY